MFRIIHQIDIFARARLVQKRHVTENFPAKTGFIFEISIDISLLWIREFDWLYYRLLSADSQQLRISAHRASCLNLM